jgi:U3 small nucleolar RNA-associated protein 22
MESGSKRRKLGHDGSGIRHDGLIDFESRSSARVSTASTFVLQTDELLKQTKVDYAAAFKGLDSQLHNLKGIIDSIEPHDPQPVKLCHAMLFCRKIR